MENMNVHYIEAPYVNKSDSKFGSCTTRKIAQITSWIMLVVHGFFFAWVFGNTLFMMIYRKDEDLNNVGVIWDRSTKEFKTTNSEVELLFDYYGDLLITNIQLGVGLAFSILLVFGVYKRSTCLMLIWIIYFIAACGVMILVCIFEGESYSSFKKILTLKLICLNFIVFLVILSYFKELKEENAKVNNTRQIRVTVAPDPIRSQLPQNFQNHLHWPFNQPAQSVILPGEKN